MKQVRQLGSILALAVAVSHLVGCGGSGDGAAVPYFVTNFLSTVSGPASSTVGISDRSPPAATGGPDATVTPTFVSVVNGGLYQATLTSPTAFSQILLWTALGGVAQPGLWHVTLAAPTTSAQLLVEVPAVPPAYEYEVYYALTNSTQAFGTPAKTKIRVISAINGDIQANVSWDSAADIDLHVIEPSGEETYFGHTRSATGSVLDVDSNAGCRNDGIQSENIAWPGPPPAGQYIVRVAHFSACGTGATGTNFAGLIRLKGSNPQLVTFQGSYPPGAPTNGGAGGGVEVARVTFTP